jgi:rhodanese-related sulfurtransferase
MPAEVRKVGAAALRAMLLDDEELALVDVREERVFSESHLLFARSVPLSRLELRFARLVPRRATRIVLVDEADGLAQRAAEVLGAAGYSGLQILDGGNAAWAAAGYELFSGVNVPSKAFGEFIEHENGTPSISAQELHDLMQSGTDMVVLDSRPFDEYTRVSIPTGVNVPGAELVLRVHDLAPKPDTLVVVNCAGRTRSIIGAQSLINAGVPNKVVSLQNGTQAWHLAGFQVLKGSTARAPAASPAGHAQARAAADRVAERFGVARIDEATLAKWRVESTRRTLYVFDVRDPGEYAAAHLSGMKNVPGGQLVQETDRHAATWGARVVLVDNDGVRAVMTAHWMKQMGWDAHAMTTDLLGHTCVSGGWKPHVLGIDGVSIPTIDAQSLRQRLQAGGVSVVDLDFSRDYRDGHIPGAWYGIRSRLDAILPQLPSSDTVVFTSSDGMLARLAAADAKAMAAAPMLALEGGTAAWRSAGYPLEQGATRMATAPDDVRLRAREQAGGIEAAMRAYLSWEIDLAEQMAKDDDQRFRIST